MSDVVRLLRTDEMQLARVGEALQRGHFVIVVASPEEWMLAARILGVARSPAFTLRTAEDVLTMFASPEARSDGIVLLYLEKDASDVIGALNLNREKLIDRRCRFLLHLPDEPSLRRFAEEAPDGYSVRDALAILETRKNHIVLTSPRVDSSEIDRKLDAICTAEEALGLGNQLSKTGPIKKAHKALDRGIRLLSRWPLSTEDRATLAALYYHRTAFTSRSERHDRLLKALRILESIKDSYQEQYNAVADELCDANGLVISFGDRMAAHGGSRITTTRQDLFIARSYLQRGDVSNARKKIDQIHFPPSSFEEHFYKLQTEIEILLEEGNWRDATARSLKLVTSASKLSRQTQADLFLMYLAETRARQGELDWVKMALAHATNPAADRLRVEIFCQRGDRDAILRMARSPDCDSPSPLEDDLDAIRAAVHWLPRAQKAGLLEESSLSAFEDSLRALSTRLAETQTEIPPWLAIDAELLLADLHQTRAAPQLALEAAQRALLLTRWGAPELVAKCIHRIAVARLLLGETEALGALLDEAIRCTEAHHLPGEAARIAGLRLWLAIRRGDGVEEAENALEEAFARTGSVLVQAEVLLRVGRGAGRRDLLLRARRLYHALPWPEREGACLESLGRLDGARRLYETFGLRLSMLAVDHRPEPPPDDTDQQPQDPT